MELLTDLGSSHGWTLHRGVLGDGREVFVKRAGAEHAGVLRAEAAGLRWLGEVPGAPVPEVIEASGTQLVLPWLPTEHPDPAEAERFGRELAAVHRAGAPAFGAPWPGHLATLPLDNTETAAWPEFYALRRLAPYLPALAPEARPPVERVIEEIGALAGPPEPPARIHGDLWSGNVHWSGGRGWLIDPAAHGGHRETDLAMLTLFGAPHLERIHAGYGGTAPLAPGWRERVPLHQLHPLLAHAALFGGAYHAAAADAARRALAAAGR